MDVVWLKRDVRVIDHGPLSAVALRKGRPTCILYLYEPDQLSEKTVHGSHIAFINEGLLDLDRKLSKILGKDNDEDCNHFRVLTVAHCEAVTALEAIHGQYSIARLLAHQETGHMASFERDKRVRRFCKRHRIPFIEFQQTGVTRCLKNRDDFAAKLKTFLSKPQHKTPNHFACQFVTDVEIPGQAHVPLLQELTEIPEIHRIDREHRQRGGESEAMVVLQSFLNHRGAHYSSHISSPNTSWSSCSRLSTYLSWGHVSLRHVVQAVQQRQAGLRASKQQADGPWLKSLAAFSSRLHWRSHFMQKLESEPELELRDLCPAYQPLRRQPGDWNQEYYLAWSQGRTGFPFVDACMRCLLSTGWINFRMRAMLVSFATYNLWLDWKRIAPHLARVFLDFEPGIHYPQLQMQAGTTGINAMRVYNVTKQGKDQDPKGVFIRKYVPELQLVPDCHIHEPWKLSKTEQKKNNVFIGADYPAPIVDEMATARLGKQRLAEVRKQNETQRQAQQVYEKHGSRSRRDAPPTKKRKKENGQQSIVTMFKKMATAGPSTTSWNCAVCTFLNDKPAALACAICGTTRNASP